MLESESELGLASESELGLALESALAKESVLVSELAQVSTSESESA